MTGELEAAEREQRDEIADVQRIGRGIKAAVERDGAFGQAFRQGFPVGAVGEEAAPFQLFDDVHWAARLSRLRARRSR